MKQENVNVGHGIGLLTNDRFFYLKNWIFAIEFYAQSQSGKCSEDWVDQTACENQCQTKKNISRSLLPPLPPMSYSSPPLSIIVLSLSLSWGRKWVRDIDIDKKYWEKKGVGRLVSRGVIEYSHGQNKRPSVHFVWEGEAQIERYWNIFLRSTMSKLRVDIIWLQNLSIYAGILMVGCKRVSAVDFQARGGEIFLKQLEKYFCKVWRNIDDWSPVKLGNMQVINPSAKSASIPGISLQILIRLQLHLGCSRGPSIHKGLICPFFWNITFFWEKEHFFFLKAVCQYYACKFMQKVSFDKKKITPLPFLMRGVGNFL